MTPAARHILKKVAEEFGVHPSEILTKGRKAKLVLARIEAAKRLAALGPIYSLHRIGEILNRDHTTIVFYLGRGQKKPSSLLQKRTRRWKKPIIRHLHCEGCYRCYFPERPLEKPKKPPKPVIYYLKPYAGADCNYVWRERGA